MVVIHRTALEEIRAHGQSSPTLEVCGVLVGDRQPDGAGDCAVAEVAIRGLDARSQAGAVTFTAETWKHIQDVLDRDYPDKRIVGWYHTHPNFGIFLSDMDLFIHSQFFSQPWQVAFVYDPIREEEGMFTWQDGKALPGPFAVKDDEAPAPAAASVSAGTRQLQRTLAGLLVGWLVLLALTLTWFVVLPSLRGS